MMDEMWSWVALALVPGVGSDDRRYHDLLRVGPPAEGLRASPRRLAADLGGRGVTIVSGLARGVDSAAHRGALDAGGRTVAVLGSGIDVVYPPENRALAGDVAAAGALVSQFPMGAAPLPQHFPVR